MGLGPKFSLPESPRLGEPQAHRFSIVEMDQVEKNVVALISYPDATEYEGVKLLVYRHTSVEAVWTSLKLDPHFLESSPFPTPFARFEPTSEGLEAAFALAAVL